MNDETNTNTKIDEYRKFPSHEWEEIGESLEMYHSIFQKFWDLGKPHFSNEIPTAAVSFDKVGQCIDFIVNPKFWDGLTKEQKVFVLCHEVTHVLFYHGFRINTLKDKQDLITANLALDIVVNHFLVDNLGFDRQVVDPENKYCWIDTIFEDPKNRPFTGQMFEFYFSLIRKELEKNPNLKSKMSLDDHSSLDSFLSPGFERMMSESVDNNTDQSMLDSMKGVKEQVKKELDAAQKEGKSTGGKMAGTSAGNSWVLARVEKVIPKRKWETVIKRWAAKYLEEKVAEQWQKPHRRLVNMPRNFLIPAEHEIEEYEKKRIPVWFFQDTSGSCAHLADRFFAAASSLPEDRFIVKMHCFDTRVYETDLKSKKLFGFGGTSFTCIEEYIKSHCSKNNVSYPEACFIITDGYGDVVKPEKPNRWYWFLSENYKHCIPAESHTFNLKDFE